MLQRRAALHPYTIRLDHRPIRIGFLVGHEQATREILDSAIRFNCTLISGRFNPFVVTDGKELDRENWRLLQLYDPDYIVSFIELTPALISEIEDLLTPLGLTWPGDDRLKEDPCRLLHHHSLSITPLVPTPDILHSARRAHWDLTVADLVLSEGTPDDIYAFVNQNLGTWRNRASENARAGFKSELFEIQDEASLETALDGLSKHGVQCAYPMQFASAYGRIRGYARPYYYEDILVVIGDAITDRLGAWNAMLTLHEFSRRGMPIVWIPKSICERPRLRDSLGRWLSRTAEAHGHGPEAARFWSTSIDQLELETIAEQLMPRGSRMARNVQRDWYPTLPEVKSPRVIDIAMGHEVFRAAASEEHIALTTPEYLVPGGGSWMVDVYIEYNPTRYSNYVDKTFWWQIPRRNAVVQHLLSVPGRVTGDRFPSMPVQTGQRVSINVIDESTFFHFLVVDDRPSATPQTRISGIQHSDAGRYLQGLVRAFGGLSDARAVLEERFWRDMFARMGGRRPESEEERREIVTSRIRKALQRLDRSEDIDKAAEKIAGAAMQYAREEFLGRREKPIGYIETLAKAEFETFKSSDKVYGHWEYEDQHVREAVYRLMESGILSAGIRRTCPACASSNSYDAAELRNQLRCRGCGTRFPLRPEERWYYRLNALVDAACNSHGITPVVLVLGQLLNEAALSFLYRPPTTLLREIGSGESAYRELDVLCVQDGRLIIGEVKESLGLFHKEDFDSIRDVAITLRPDLVIFSALVPEPNGYVSRQVERVKEELSPYGIETRWYSLNPWVFEASPVR